ncbi:DUF1156 domain-containing protein [Halobacteria archaeon HArc-gm2]|nr:DUF1156 domain-containing protein [Halobacteria archaeon HArc-gm2]
MSQEIGESEEGERKTLPIEKGFPIERVNEIAEKEGRGIAKRYYRPIYTMHKWWARRLGCVFRSVALYSLLDDPEIVDVSEPGQNGTLSDYTTGNDEVKDLIESVDLADPDSLWKLYSKDVKINGKKVLDPFMGGGTPMVESSRFGATTVGGDLNPVAWFISKKEIETGDTDIEKLDEEFDNLKQEVSEEIKSFYKTPCPNSDEHKAEVMNYFWVKQVDCTSCENSVPLFRDYRVAKGRYDKDGQQIVLCPDCSCFFDVSDWQGEVTCDHCKHTFDARSGPAGGSHYTCHDCGQKYEILDAIEEQDGFDLELFGLEYFCESCDAQGLEKSVTKGYKPVEEFDRELYQEAVSEWESRDDLNEYVPSEEIPLGIKTDSTKFSGNITGGHNVLRQGFTKWKDMFNPRQLLSLSKLLKEIDAVENKKLKEYFLLSFSDSLRGNTLMVNYQVGSNAITNVFKTNSFDPPKRPTENNPWGASEGARTFLRSYERLREGVKYGNEPFDRYVDDDGETVKSPPFNTSVGEDSSVYQGDVRDLDQQDEYDAVITDPPYYDNVIYSELSDYFYVWQRIILKDEYEWFSPPTTPRAESIVANPAEGKGASEFEEEIKQALDKIHQSLKQDGVLAFTYHHSGSESWGELLQALCDVGFEVTAAYPITADLDQLVEGESVSFDIIIVARPAQEREPISWNSLRREIYRTAQKTRTRLEENRDLSRGDIGVVEMGRCFHEYSKHHGKVERAGKEMTAKEVVDEIYGVIQHGSDIGEIDVFLDLLETPGASYDDLNKLTRGTNATPERMEDMRLYRMDEGFKLGTWDDEKRIAYIQSRVDSDEELTDLDKAQFLRYRWEHGKSVSEYLGKWEITDDLRELCEGLADATGDDTYRNILESRLSDY